MFPPLPPSASFSTCLSIVLVRVCNCKAGVFLKKEEYLWIYLFDSKKAYLNIYSIFQKAKIYRMLYKFVY